MSEELTNLIGIYGILKDLYVSSKLKDFKYKIENSHLILLLSSRQDLIETDHQLIVTVRSYQTPSNYKRLAEAGDLDILLNTTTLVKYSYNGLSKLEIWRDKIGLRPIYYFIDNDFKIFIFSTSLKTLISYIRKCYDINVDTVGLLHYLCYGYCACNRNIFKGVYKVSPGCRLLVSILDSKSIHVKEDKYWNLPRRTLSLLPSIDVLSDMLYKVLKYAIESCIGEDVSTIYVLFSGGLDSGTVVSILKRFFIYSVYPISVYFDIEDLEPYVKDICSYLGLEADVLFLDEDLAMKYSKEIGNLYDEPLGEIMASIKTLYALRELRKRLKARTVVLTGEGGDEIFFGYPWLYDLTRSLTYIQRYFPFTSKIIDYQISKFWWLIDERTLLTIFQGLKKNALTMVKRELSSILKEYTALDPLTKAYILSFKALTQRFGFQRPLQLGMRTGISVKFPYLNPLLISFMYSLPYHYKQRKYTTKLLLRYTLLKHELIPKNAILQTKRGFGSIARLKGLFNLVDEEIDKNIELLLQYLKVSTITINKKAILNAPYRFKIAMYLLLNWLKSIEK